MIRDAPISRLLLQHHRSRIALSTPVGFQQFRVNDESIPVLHQQISAIAQLRILARAPARHLLILVRLRLMGLDRALFSMKARRWITGIVRRRALVLSLRLKTFHADPGL